MTMNAAAAAGLGVVLVLLALVLRWKWRSTGKVLEIKGETQLMHKLCPHNNVVQSVLVEQKDSIDAHLDILTRKLAEKEGRLLISKSKIRETQNEIGNLHAIDQDVRAQYRDIMNSLRTDLKTNEIECKKLQEQIEWVSRRRAELKEEVRRGQKLYGEAVADLATNVTDMQKSCMDPKVTAKPHGRSCCPLRHRKEPLLPRSTPLGSLVLKPSPPPSTIFRPEELPLKPK